MIILVLIPNLSLSDGLGPSCKLSDHFGTHFKSNPRLLRGDDPAVCRDLNSGFDNVFMPVAFRGGDVTRECKAGERRHCNVMGPAYARLEHAAAPDRNFGIAAGLLDQFCLRVAAHTAEFYIDDLA